MYRVGPYRIGPPSSRRTPQVARAAPRVLRPLRSEREVCAVCLGLGLFVHGVLFHVRHLYNA